MWLFPYQMFSVASSLKPNDAILQLTKYISSPPSGKYSQRISFWLLRNFKQYFIGSVSGDKFKIHRAIKGTNSFLPMIKGIVSESAEGSKILIRMRIHPIILVFCCWILIVGFYNKSTINHIVFIYESTPTFLFIAFYCLCLFMFKYEAQKDKQMLLDIFKGELES